MRKNPKASGKITKNAKEKRERNKYPAAGAAKSLKNQPSLTKKQLRKLATQSKQTDDSVKKINKKQKLLKNEGKDFRNQLVDDLKSSRFRFINELLYTRRGKDAVEIFKEDTEAFQTYHDGYRQQVEYWPINPLDRLIKSIKNL